MRDRAPESAGVLVALELEVVEERLVEVAAVLRRMPPVKVPGYFNPWQRVVHDFGDLVEQEPPKLRMPYPSPDAITRMEETLGWTAGLRSHRRPDRSSPRVGTALERHLLEGGSCAGSGARALALRPMCYRVEAQRAPRAEKSAKAFI